MRADAATEGANAVAQRTQGRGRIPHSRELPDPSVSTVGTQTSPDHMVPETVAELRPGVVLFFARPSLLQRWAEMNGHEWRHVGIVVETDDGLAIAGFARRQKYFLMPIEAIGSYTRVGVAAPFTSEREIANLHRWCEGFANRRTEDLTFATSSPLVGQLRVMAERSERRLSRWLLLGMCRSYCAMQSTRYRDSAAFVCSTFAMSAINAAKDEPLRLPLSQSTAQRSTVEAAEDENSTLDLRLARWLCGPTELWRSLPSEVRGDLHLGDPHLSSGLEARYGGNTGTGGKEAVVDLVDHATPAGVPARRRESRRTEPLTMVPSC